MVYGKGVEQHTLIKYLSGDKPIIFADYREISSEVVEFLRRKGAEVKEMQLEVGDYLISKEVVIERKTASDFLNSLMDGRLFNQLASMLSYDKPLLIVEGTPRELFVLRDVNKNALIGALAAISLDFRVPILFSESKAQTANFIYIIAKRIQQGKDREISLRKKRAMSLKEQQQFIVESLPLIGPKTAKRLLQHFGSVRGVFSATQKELESIPNIGKKKAKKIIEIIEAKYIDAEK
ncbi:MAG: hypothetical protein J7L44_01350 [Candidatus Diapherotrites archaeon]|nr:hypothetical protein [Candidatus Diapherotrites archaeon]